MNCKKTLRIHTDLKGFFSKSNVYLRRTLADTIEERGVGEVFNEEIGEDYIEITLEMLPSKQKEEEIKSILRALGILESTSFIFIENDDASE